MKKLSEISCDDRKFLDIVERGTIKRNGCYVVPLPLRDQELVMPNNKQQAVKRLMGLKRRFIRNDKFFLDYKKHINDLLEKGYARRCNETPIGKTSYIPHHAVYHPRKPGKIRVVFDCSAEFEGKSINKELLPGPDLTNQIVSILIRFHEEKAAVMADVESMYYQVQVPENQQTYLKFLWWENSDIECHPQEFVMCAHVLGGASSGGCSNYTLRRTAVDNEAEFGKAAATTLLNNFYVDDLLKSVGNINIAKQLVKDVISMCGSGGFNLTKFVSNSKELLQSIPEQQRRQGTKDKDLSGDLPTDKALGICWNVADDTFSFKIRLDRTSLTKRTMLSMISSIYDPLGFAAPFVLEGRRILQGLCNQNLPWDMEVNDGVKKEWNKFITRLKHVDELYVRRCIRPDNFWKISKVSIHHFSDASEQGYGQCSYIRMVDEKGRIHCTLLLGKSRVVPKRFVSIPRLELTAAVLLTKMACLLKKVFSLGEVNHQFWTDNKVVLGYIKNDTRRFKTFVANRIYQIKENTNDASRGLSAEWES